MNKSYDEHLKDVLERIRIIDKEDEESINTFDSNEIGYLQDYINQLEKQLEYYKVKEVERLTDNLLQARNDCLGGYDKYGNKTKE